jgi:hypothetical protein
MDSIFSTYTEEEMSKLQAQMSGLPKGPSAPKRGSAGQIIKEPLLPISSDPGDEQPSYAPTEQEIDEELGRLHAMEAADTEISLVSGTAAPDDTIDAPDIVSADSRLLQAQKHFLSDLHNHVLASAGSYDDVDLNKWFYTLGYADGVAAVGNAAGPPTPALVGAVAAVVRFWEITLLSWCRRSTLPALMRPRFSSRRK